MSVAIDKPRRTNTETPARLPDEQGSVDRDGVSIHWELHGTDGPTILLLPTWTIVHSRMWKAQIGFLARHFRVLTFDGRGNGLSDRPAEPDMYREEEYAADAIAVMDATRTQSAVLGALSRGAERALLLAAHHPERVGGIVFIAPALPIGPVPLRDAAERAFIEPRESYDGWGKFSRNYWLEHYGEFVEFFFSRVFTEPHSTKQIEDAVAWARDTDAATLVATQLAVRLPDEASVRALTDRVSCPMLVIHGSHDDVRPYDSGAALAAMTGCPLVTLEGAGHCPQARDPVKVNLLLREFAEQVSGRPPRATTWIRPQVRARRALLVSSPIGLGHAWRDVAIADELRKQVPGLEVHWLAQAPVTTVLEHRGETIHPASAELSSEVQHIDREAAGHDLHAFQALRRMDDIFSANFMVFHDLVCDEAYDVWIGDEAWEVDHFLHENPELKTAPYVWLSDFVGYLPMPGGGEHEAFLTADYNAEMIEHIERYPRVRDRAIFIGDPEDIVERDFGPRLPPIRAWTERHFEFVGYVPGFDPRRLADRKALRRELGYDDGPLCIVSVGGSGVGEPLLRRVTEALPLARERIPELRMLAVAGPRIDPTGIPAVEGLEVVGYVHELYRHLAACDLAVVQGGLTTTMELVCAGRPFISLPLSSHFEQRFHVRHRLDRYGARSWLEYAEATPERLAEAIAAQFGTTPRYRPADYRAAARAANSIAAVLTEVRR